jgi:hypothetical protein
VAAFAANLAGQLFTSARFAFVAFMNVWLIEVQDLLAPPARHCQVFTRQDFDRRHSAPIHRSCGYRRISMTVIVVLEVFEYVADVQKRIPVQADVHECGLHARQYSRHFSFVDAADKRELFFALNVDLD